MLELRCPKCNTILLEENIIEGEARGFCRKCKVYVHKQIVRVEVPFDRPSRDIDNNTVLK